MKRFVSLLLTLILVFSCMFVNSVASAKTKCKHHSYKTYTVKATYFAKGKKVTKCKKCGKVKKSKTVAGKRVLKTPKFTVLNTYNTFKVKVTKVKNQSGIEIKYRLKGADTWKKKTFTAKNTTTKEIENIKKDKYYQIKVRAYIKSGKKKAYSNWAKTVTVINKTAQKTVTMHAANYLSVQKGESIAQNVNLQGKTILMAVPNTDACYNNGAFNRTITAFETKYDCTVAFEYLNFNEYNSGVSKLIAAGKSPDIAYCHGSMFPACAIDGLYEDVLPTLRSADLMYNNNPLGGGIDLNKSSYFAFGGKLYGTCNYASISPYVFFYNKKKFNDMGLDDPRTLASKNKWTWKKIESMGQQVTNVYDDIYFLSASTISGRMITLAYGAPIVKAVNGKYKQNVDSKEYIAACQYIWKLGYSANPIAASVSEGKHGYDDYNMFLRGDAFMWGQESSKYADLMIEVPNSYALRRTKSNVGIVEVPLSTTYNYTRYPAGWLTAVCCGKGKDPKVAIAWDVFRSAYKDSSIDYDAYSPKDQVYVNSLLKGDLACEPGAFQYSFNQTNVIVANGLQPEIRLANKASAIPKIVNKYTKQIQDCIDATMKKKAS